MVIGWGVVGVGIVMGWGVLLDIWGIEGASIGIGIIGGMGRLLPPIKERDWGNSNSRGRETWAFNLSCPTV